MEERKKRGRSLSSDTWESGLLKTIRSERPSPKDVM